MTYIKENTIAKLQKLYSAHRNLRVGNKLPMLFLKEPLCMGDLLSTCIIFIERPVNDTNPYRLTYFLVLGSTEYHRISIY